MTFYLPYDQLLNGSFFGSVFNVYDTSFGGGGIVYLMFYAAIIILIALATESPAPVAVFTILGALMFLPMMSGSYQKLVYTIAVLGIAITLYKIFIHKRGSQI